MLSLLIREDSSSLREVGVLGDPKLVTFRTKGGPKCQTRFRSDPLSLESESKLLRLVAEQAGGDQGLGFRGEPGFFYGKKQKKTSPPCCPLESFIQCRRWEVCMRKGFDFMRKCDAMENGGFNRLRKQSDRIIDKKKRSRGRKTEIVKTVRYCFCSRHN